MDMGLFFIKPVFSKQASAPTKLGEFLGCGIPCLTNAGVGDMQQILESTETGVCINQFDEPAYQQAYQQMMALCKSSDCAKRCRTAAEQHFSLSGGVQEYAKIYRELTG